MKEKVYLAVDLGAESGRVMAGLWNGRKLRLEEIHRFPTGGVYLGDTFRWDVLRLPALTNVCGVGKAMTNAHAGGIVQSSNAASAVG